MGDVEVKALSKEELRQYENKLTFKYTAISIIFLIFLSVISLLIIFLIYLYYPAVPTKKHIKHTYTPELIKDTTGLETDGSLILTGNTDSYKITVTLKNKAGGGEIGSYLTHDHLYLVYGENPNTLNISISVYDVENEKEVTDFKNTTYDIYLGENSTSITHLDSSKFTVENNVCSYSDVNDIYLYSVTVDLDITIKI